jgi:hypothetical protein
MSENNNDLSYVDVALNKIRVPFNKAAEKINSLKKGERIAGTTLAQEVGAEIGVSGSNFYPTLLFLLRDYPNTELKRGVKGGVCKINDEAADLAYVDTALNKIRAIFDKAATRINSLNKGERVAGTVLATEIGKDFDISGPNLYHTLIFLFDGYPGTVRKNGVRGGIEKI